MEYARIAWTAPSICHYAPFSRHVFAWLAIARTLRRAMWGASTCFSEFSGVLLGQSRRFGESRMTWRNLALHRPASIFLDGEHANRCGTTKAIFGAAIASLPALESPI